MHEINKVKQMQYSLTAKTDSRCFHRC